MLETLRILNSWVSLMLAIQHRASILKVRILDKPVRLLPSFHDRLSESYLRLTQSAYVSLMLVLIHAVTTNRY